MHKLGKLAKKIQNHQKLEHVCKMFIWDITQNQQLAAAVM